MASGDAPPSCPSGLVAAAGPEASAELPRADGGLTCPVWVQFLDPITGFPYFYNVETHQRLWSDPDPEGDVRCCRPQSEPDETTPAPDKGEEAAAATDAEVGAGAAEGALAATSGASAAAAPDPDGAVGAARAAVGGRSAAEDMRAERSAWWQRPARVQREWQPDRTQYTEGSEEYNPWYSKYESDRFNPKDREPASFRCDPDRDSGYTLVDLPNGEASFFCLFFAKGCCNKGNRCTYYHHLPTLDDTNACDMAHDIFGRERFASHRDDLDGVGCFNDEGRTLYVGDLRFDRTLDRVETVKVMEKQVREAFGAWGDLEEVRLISTKAIAFVRYRHRGAAEFAKVAMANQTLGLAKCIRVRWALEDPNPRVKKQARLDRCDLVDEAVLRHAVSLGLTEVEVANLQLNNQPKGFRDVTAPYPDTSAQYPQTPAAKPAIGPLTSHEAKRKAEALAELAEERVRQAEATENLDRMHSVLARIDAMHNSGAIPEAEEL